MRTYVQEPNRQERLLHKRKQGQALVVVVLMTAVLVALFVTSFDIFLTTRQKTRLINAGDAGALAAASWQGKTLNLIGELNLVHLAAACDPQLDPTDRTNVIDGVNALAERFAFIGPVMGLYAANRAVAENYRANVDGPDQTIPVDWELAQIIREEQAFVRANVTGTSLWRNKGADYASMLDSVLADGVYVGCDNAHLFSSGGIGSHIYYQHAFYEAANREGAWTWFCRYCGYNHNKAIALLRNTKRPEADDLAFNKRASLWNAGFFGVGVQPNNLPIAGQSPNPESALLRMWNDYAGGPPVNAASINYSAVAYDSRFAWFYLSPSAPWRPWRELAANGEGRLALLAEVKASYDVYGPMAAVRVGRSLGTLAGVTNNFTWMASAKAFGELKNGNRVTDLFDVWNGGTWSAAPLVTPAFSVSRLIALGGVGANNLYQADSLWLKHLEHLRNDQRVPSCRRCRCLDEWENGLAAQAAEWLQNHPHEDVCAPPGKGPGYDDDDFAQ